MSSSEKVGYTSRVRIERERGPVRRHTCLLKGNPSSLGYTLRSRSTIRSRRTPSRPTQRHSIMWLQQRLADSREPLGVRWNAPD